MKTPTNTELLSMSEAEAKLLTGIERQRRFIMRIQAQKQPCPNCGTKQDVFEAGDIKMDDYDFGVTNHSYRCVSCKRELEHCVPLIPIGGSWLWSLVPITPSAEITTIEYSINGKPFKTEPMVFRRLYAVGQALTMDSTDFEVVSVAVDGAIQKVGLKPCTVCRSCGGLPDAQSERFGCICRQGKP